MYCVSVVGQCIGAVYWGWCIEVDILRAVGSVCWDWCCVGVLESMISMKNWCCIGVGVVFE